MTRTLGSTARRGTSRAGLPAGGRALGSALVLAAGCAGPGTTLPAWHNPSIRGAIPIQGEERLLRLTEWTPPTGQLCAVADSSVAAPGALVDSAAVRRALQARHDTVAPRSGGLLLHVWTDSAGLDFWRIETTLTTERADALEDAVRAARAPDPPPMTGRLLVTLEDGDIRLRTGPVLMCQPLMINAGEVQQVFDRASRSGGARGRVVLHMYVTPDGDVTDVRVEERSGDVYLDEISAAIASRALFYPALLDRLSIPVWVSIDFTAR